MSWRKKSGKEVSIIRSSAAEYLTFIAAVGKSETSAEMRYEDENIWLTQKMMATLYDVLHPLCSLTVMKPAIPYCRYTQTLWLIVEKQIRSENSLKKVSN